MFSVLIVAFELLASAEGASVTIALVLDFAFRMIPSEKPLSIFHLVAKVAGKIGQFLVKFAELADKVLPQKLK